MTDKKLSYAERLILSNQFQILKLLDPEQTKHYDEAQEIVNSGYEYLYESINQSVSETVLPIRVSEQVVEILNMFRAIEFSCRKLGVEPKSLQAEFDGFDANEGGGHYRFAQFLRRVQGRWEELSGYPDNSHSAVSLSHYFGMIKRWEKLGKKYELSSDEIVEIVGLSS